MSSASSSTTLPPIRTRLCITQVKKLLAVLTKPVSSEKRKAAIPKTLSLNPRPVSESQARATIPIISHADPDFRLSYVDHENNVRIGKLLEDLDMFAGWIAYRHNSDQEYKDGTSPLSIVTACVDSVEIYQPIVPATQDLYMFGIVSWCGSSSMEITMHLTTEQHWDLTEYFTEDRFKKAILHSKFVMVARDHGAEGKAAKVYPLEINHEIYQKLFDLGAANKNRRLEESKTDLIFKPPTKEESDEIHKKWLKRVDPNTMALQESELANQAVNNQVFMKETGLKSCTLCQPEYKNVHNKIFGGFLMKMAIELGEANYSLIFHENLPRCIDVADISFKAPVEIGSLLLMESKIIATRNRMAVIRVHAQVTNPNVGRRKSVSSGSKLQRNSSILDANHNDPRQIIENLYTTTNIFYFVFESKSKWPLPEIMPETYGESLLYIDGQRCVERMLKRYASKSDIL